MGTKEDMLKVWVTEAERIKAEAVERVRGEVAKVEYHLTKLVADWKAASEGFSVPAFEVLAKGGRVMTLETYSPDRDDSLQCSLYNSGTYIPPLFLPKGSYRIIVMAIRQDKP